MGMMDAACIRAYRMKLEHEISEYMDMPVSERTVEAISGMLECLAAIKAAEHCAGHAVHGLTREEAESWNEAMLNDDGSTGGRWTVDQTSAAMSAADVPAGGVSPWCWNVTMNMMFSDYGRIAEKYGLPVEAFSADLAKAFLFDKDGGEPGEKLAAYYHGIVLPSLE